MNPGVTDVDMPTRTTPLFPSFPLSLCVHRQEGPLSSINDPTAPTGPAKGTGLQAEAGESKDPIAELCYRIFGGEGGGRSGRE